MDLSHGNLIDKKIEEIFKFLENNRKPNQRIHTFFYKRDLSLFKKPEDKVISLLHGTVNTQSQLNLDRANEFFKKMEKNKKLLKTFNGLLIALGASKDDAKFPSYEILFRLLESKKNPGWGPKTSALFVKAIYNIHYGKQKNLSIYKKGVPKLGKNDSLKVPVDIVIANVFRKINIGISPQYKIKPTFNEINTHLKKKYSGRKIVVWDDLWFWGFITQKGSGNNRLFKYNEAKYMSILPTDKTPKEVIKIKKEASSFLKILNKPIR